MKLSDMLFANAMMGEGGGGGGGYPIWNVVCKIPPLADGGLSAAEVTDDNYILATPLLNNRPRSAYDVNLESGYEETLSFMVFDVEAAADLGCEIGIYGLTGHTITVTGACTYLDDGEYGCWFTVKGDCTITVS